jgi:hypothetical protein
MGLLINMNKILKRLRKTKPHLGFYLLKHKMSRLAIFDEQDLRHVAFGAGGGQWTSSRAQEGELEGYHFNGTTVSSAHGGNTATVTFIGVLMPAPPPGFATRLKEIL